MVAKIVGQALGHPKIGIKDDMDSVLKWDSLSHISVILAIEKVVGFSFTPKEIAESNSVENIHNIINNNSN